MTRLLRHTAKLLLNSLALIGLLMVLSLMVAPFWTGRMLERFI